MLAVGPFSFTPGNFFLPKIEVKEAQAGAGEVILMWEGATAPDGWTCISCSGGDPFFDVFPRASTTYGGSVIGSNTHTHTLSFLSAGSASGTDTATVNDTNPAEFPSNAHTHTWGNPEMAYGDHRPPYRGLMLIRAATTTLPNGAIGFFDTTSSTLPSAWSYYSAAENLLVMGTSTAGNGGASSHTHFVSSTLTSGGAGDVLDDTGGGVNVGASGHTHDVATTNSFSAANNTNPPFATFVFGQLNSTTTLGATSDGLIAMFDDPNLPTNWSQVTTSSIMGKFILASSTAGNTGGGETAHDHGGSVTWTSEAASALLGVKSGALSIKNNDHTHTVSYNSISSVTPLPAYRDVILGKFTFTITPETTIANGTQLGNRTIAPEANATTSAVFTFVTNTGTDIITAVTSTLATSTGIAKIEITNDAGTTVYGSSTNPTASSFTITLNESTLTASTTLTSYRIRITPSTHANMPAPPGAEIVVTSTISNWTGTNTKAGSNTTSSIITIDNLSPGEVTATSTTPGQGQIDLAWTNPADGDFSNLVIVRATSSAVTGNPTEGTSPSSGDTIGNGIVMYTSNGTSTTDSGLSDSTTYHYKIWAKDTNGNYSAAGVALSATTNAAVTPVIRTAANETFTVSSTSVAIAAITVTSTAASQITAANDIRVSIATGTTNFRWDTSDTLATIGGTGNVSTTVSYENGSSTLVVDVLTDFANASSVTISGLSYRDFNGANAATTTFDLRWEGAAQSPPFARATTTTVTIRGRLDLAQHSAGQESDKFATSSTASNQELFAFELAPRDESASTTLVVDLSGITGIVTGDIANPKIFVDADASGSLGGGETTQHFGNGTVSVSGGTGTITFNATTSTVPSATSTRYILIATTTNLLAGDTITFSLGTSTITADGQTSKIRLDSTSSSTVSNAVHTVNNSSRTQRSFRWQNDDGVDVNSNTAMAASGTAVTDVKIGQRLTLRFQVDNDGGGESSGLVYHLQFQANSTSGSWTDVASGNAVQDSQGLAGANGASITSAVAATNSRTFTNGTWHEGTADTGGATAIPNAGYTEIAYMIETSKAASSTTYYFRVASNTGPTALDAYTEFPSLVTVASSSHLTQYSKQAGSLPSTTSSLTYFFDDLDYTRAASDDGTYSTSTAATNIPIFNFRVRNTTSSHPLKITWNGQYSAASTTFVEAYRFGSTNAWQTLDSTSTPSVDTDFTLTGYVTSSVSEYYEADGPNFWTFFRVRQATTTGSLRTDSVNVEFIPAIDSNADQTFEVNQASTTISQVRIRTTRTPVVTAANGIRIKIPSAFNMKWATSTIIASLGGSASGKASTTVSYPDDQTLLVNVTSDFAASDDLTIDGLKFANFTAASASTTLQAFYNGTSTGNAEAVDSKVVQVRGLFALDNHGAGQEGDKFDSSGGSLTAAELLAFQLSPNGENATSSQVVIDLYDVKGIVTANITNAEIRVDADNDGAISGGETTTVGGSGSVSISGGSGTITFSTSFNVNATTSYILRADVASIDPEDYLRLRVAPSNLTATGNTSKISLSPTGNTPSVTHARKSGRSGGGPVEVPPAVANVGGGGQGGGGGAEGGGGGSPPNQGGGGQGGGGGGVP